MHQIYTIGHSNITYEEFLAKLDGHSIERLIDVRSHPGSKTVPWTNRASLASALGDRYLWMPELGGSTQGDYSDPKNFPKHRIGLTRPEFKHIAKKDRPNKWWNQGLADYDQWMATDSKFQQGLVTLDGHAKDRRVAIMCSEALWWKCHRSMISDVWAALGGSVMHIFTDTKAVSHPTGDDLKGRLDRYEHAQVLWEKQDAAH